MRFFFVKHIEFVTLRVPHGLAILERGDVCVADRENMRIICVNAGLRADNDINNNNNNNERRGPPLTLHQPDLGRVFAVAAHGIFYILKLLTQVPSISLSLPHFLQLVYINIKLHINTSVLSHPCVFNVYILLLLLFYLISGNILYAVNGPTSPMIPIRGFIMDPKTEDIFGSWAPTTGVSLNLKIFIRKFFFIINSIYVVNNNIVYIHLCFIF